MCIIVVKPKSVPLPDREILKNCFQNNPDGAGIMYRHKGMVHGVKGLMDFKSFMAELDALPDTIGNLTDADLVFHFRIGTSGENDKGNTHPFPSTDDYNEMRKTRWTSHLGMCHNGIMHNITSDPDIRQYRISDTMVFVKKFLYPMAKRTSVMEDKEAQYILYHAANSKLVFMDDNALITLGDFSTHDGCLYSNSTWQSYREYTTYTPQSTMQSTVYPYYYSTYDYEDTDYSSAISVDLMLDDAEYMGLLPVAAGYMEPASVWLDNGETMQLTDSHAVDPESGDIYRWNSKIYQWEYTGKTLSPVFINE